MTMDGAMLARIGAIIFIAFAITAAVLELRDDKRPAHTDFTIHAARPSASDPLHAELLRCQQLGEAATRDSDCLKAWAESRRRFLSPSSSEEAAQ
jgi:conjugative transfer region protein TrbK